MLGKFRKWRERRLLARHPIAESHWQHALAHCRPARRLAASDQAALRVLVTRFLERKAIDPVKGLELAEADRVLLATHACMPILHLGLGWYRNWYSIIVYPDVFVPRREHRDAAGVVHATSDPLAGEAWGQGPVILSWADVLESGRKPGHNVVIHEMAHKLDMLQGSANGFPPLHRKMDTRKWEQAFTTAWHRMHNDDRDGMALAMDAYALENPAEFFAVASEHFFEEPADIREKLPDVHRQLALFYRQSSVS